MPLDVITADQLKYHRLVANKDGASKDRWQKTFSWCPGRQNIDFNRVAQIYCDSYSRYGEEAIMKYRY
ncbi:GH20359 [Drosophila grimshawi]|uniref:GH20359 n=1 Tax=Drosophila grimshawi TaxID=7222 RepID=B4J4C8_DROGR|nr:GH20359 [Drosophila grimshawi]